MKIYELIDILSKLPLDSSIGLLYDDFQVQDIEVVISPQKFSKFCDYVIPSY